MTSKLFSEGFMGNTKQALNDNKWDFLRKIQFLITTSGTNEDN